MQITPYLYLAPITTLLLAGALVLRARRSREGWRSAIAGPVADVVVLLAGAQLFYIVHEFALGYYSLETYFYSVYLFAFVAIGVVAAVAELARLPELGERCVLFLLAAVIAVPIARNLWFRQLELYVIPAVPLAIVGVGALLLATRWLPKAALGLAAVFVAVLILFPLAAPRSPSAALADTVWANPRYDRAIGNLGRDGLDMQELAVELMQALPKWEDDPGTLLFWYPSGDTLLDSIQSTYLWRSSAIQGFDFPAMPALNDQQRAILASRPPRHIALLGFRPEQVRGGRRALASIGLIPVSVEDAILEAGARTVHLEVLTFEAASCDQDRRKLENWIGSVLPCGQEPAGSSAISGRSHPSGSSRSLLQVA